ncbi:MAG: TlyA family RNA methyltransferase [Candidatus Melainabacteria bacterium]|nr:TlyA family RNA methyltransferase [Candidatus Melainabacteria bacterium]
MSEKSEQKNESKQKSRLDAALLERGLCASRQEAQAVIMAGGVLVNDEKVTKSGTTVRQDDNIRLLEKFVTSKFVSRGGLKLEKALQTFDLDVSNLICLDIGASTGGFTDCLLQNGADFVYAIDVGFGQIVGKLRQDHRVMVLERTNARHLEPAELYKDKKTDIAQFAVIDCSFISLDKILPATIKLLKPHFQIIALIKPQFEAGKDKIKKGVVKDQKTQIEVLEHFARTAQVLDLRIVDCCHSPLKGPKGNIEYLALLKNKDSIDETQLMDHILNFKQIVEDAFNELNQV